MGEHGNAQATCWASVVLGLGIIVAISLTVTLCKVHDISLKKKKIIYIQMYALQRLATVNYPS